MTLRLRFILTMCAIALLLVLPALYAALQLSRLREIASDISVTHGAAYLAMGRFQAHVNDIDRFTRNYVAIGEPEFAERRNIALDGAQQELERLMGAGYRDVAARADTLLSTIGSGVARIDTLLQAGATDEATTALGTVTPLFARADSLIQRIGTEIDRRSGVDLTAASRISAAALTMTLLVLVAALFIALLIGAWATQTVIRPIHRLRRATAEVAAGEFVIPAGLPYERADEIGDLSRSFRGMTQQLANLDRMKAEFMSVAAHELKTPINVVSGYAELIQDGIYGAVTDDQSTALTAIQEQSRNLAQLVNQLLDISRLEAGGMKLEIGDVSVPDLFERVHRTFDVLAHKQRINFTVTLEETAPRTVPADGARLRDQVLGNLLANALKFTPEGGRIGVRGWGEDGRLCIEVTDTGAGMPASQLPHVFDKYYQIGETARSKGAGLGLTIAHDIIEEHGGTISVSSQEGAGTTFRIRLPSSRKEMEAALATVPDESSE
ncbi:MAG TPA: ATP-binding protein [Longimicrobiales bacterium]|nr:ATP-binding protein [Longimicrobiales bacterium]